MAKKVNENWEQVVSTTYEVCDDQMGRGKNFVDTLAKALDISGDFQHWLLDKKGLDLFDKVEEALQLWNDRYFGGIATHHDLISTLQKSRRKLLCLPLIEALKASCPDYVGFEKIGKISYNPTIQLGSGSIGSAVFKGSFENREVAVRRLLKSMWSETAENEAACLIASDMHPNIVQYFCMEKSAEFIFLALQLCQSNVELMVAEENPTMRINRVSILTDVLEGLTHLHSLKPRPVCHRDLKPANILFYAPDSSIEARGVIADLGLSRQMEDATKQTFTTTSGKAMGTVGWRAPEVLQNLGATSTNTRKKLSLKLDIFPGGVMVHFVLTGGKHPFGEDIIRRDANIVDDKFDLSALSHEHSKYKTLIKDMISYDPNSRPTAMKALDSFKSLSIKQEPTSQTSTSSLCNRGNSSDGSQKQNNGTNPKATQNKAEGKRPQLSNETISTYDRPLKKEEQVTFNLQNLTLDPQISTESSTSPKLADQPKELPTPKQSDQHRQLHHMSSAQNSFPSNDQLSSSNSLNIPNHAKISLQLSKFYNGSFRQEEVIDQGVTKKGMEIFSDNSDTLTKFPDILIGSHLYKLPVRQNRLEIKIQARCSCQLIISTNDGTWRAWDEGELQNFGFTSIPGVIKTSHPNRDMPKIYLKHLKPDEKVDLPQTKDAPILTIFVK